MNVKYEILEAKPNIFAVVISNQFDRGMTFCRSQEFYECPNPAFRKNKFNMWDYIKWYSEEHGKGFSYPYDWIGFNVPFDVVHECYKDSIQFDRPIQFDTPYDKAMHEIYLKILHMKNDGDAYIVGVDNPSGDTFFHEVCHGLYYTNPTYRSQADEITHSIPKKHKDKFRKNLVKAGYAECVVEDEIQAYLTFGYDCEGFSSEVPIELCESWNKEYKKLFNNSNNI